MQLQKQLNLFSIFNEKSKQIKQLIIIEKKNLLLFSTFHVVKSFLLICFSFMISILLSLTILTTMIKNLTNFFDRFIDKKTKISIFSIDCYEFKFSKLLIDYINDEKLSHYRRFSKN